MSAVAKKKYKTYISKGWDKLEEFTVIDLNIHIIKQGTVRF